MAQSIAGGGVDLEKELSCSICTDVLYQPLTLLDCLHTFCGSCLKEWFSWQAALATHSSRVASPYSCPSCRATVKAARPNASVTTLLEMFLHANPNKGKTDQEKADMREHYKPGDDVIPPVEVHADSEDSDDARVMEMARQLSVADVDPAVEANRRADRAARHRRERERRRDDARRRQETVRRDISHQPSIVSLLSNSDDGSSEIQEEILNSILSTGILDGIDLENLTVEEEELLTERIAEAYRRRQRQQNRQERRPPVPQLTMSRAQPSDAQPRAIERWLQNSSQNSSRPSTSTETPLRDLTRSNNPPSATRSVTDPVTRTTITENETRRASSNTRSSTDNQQISRARDDNARHRVQQPQTPPINPQRLPPPYPDTHPSQSISTDTASTTPAISCTRCNKADIQFDLHYHCSKCKDGKLDLCLRCYRAGQGCDHWFGFGYMAITRWQRSALEGGWPPGYELPHILMPRRYTRQGVLQEGAFCERCSEYADQAYFHCSTCLEGAWGFCEGCTRKGMHCTHPLTSLARIEDARKTYATSLPHIPDFMYSFRPLRVECAICSKAIPANTTLLHCSQCRDGDYDICNESYNTLVSTGKISTAHGLSGRRQCLREHPLTILAYRDLPNAVQQRVIVSEPVGGWDSVHGRSQSNVTNGLRYLALWSWWPAEGVEDELAFPKFAEIKEVEQLNADYFVGVYAGSRGLFPANHVRLL